MRNLVAFCALLLCLWGVILIKHVPVLQIVNQVTLVAIGCAFCLSIVQNGFKRTKDAMLGKDRAAAFVLCYALLFATVMSEVATSMVLFNNLSGKDRIQMYLGSIFSTVTLPLLTFVYLLQANRVKRAPLAVAKTKAIVTNETNEEKRHEAA